MKYIRILRLIFIFIFCLTNLLVYSIPANAYTSANVMVNNYPVKWEAAPVYVNGIIYVPMKEISSSLQMESSFDINGLTAVLKSGENELKLKLDDNIAALNGKYIKLAGPMKIIQNRIMIPLQTFENLGAFDTYRNGTALIYKPENGKIIYKVVSGDLLWKISQMFNTSVAAIKNMNGLTSDMIYVGQQLTVKTMAPFQTSFPAVTGSATIKSGPGFSYKDVNYLAAGTGVKVTGKNGYWYKVATYKGDGYIYYTVIKVTQEISDTAAQSTFFSNKIPVDTSGDSLSYSYYTVVSGDTVWSVAEKWGIPVEELMQVNGFNWSTYLKVGQVVKVPVHRISVKQTSGNNYGEVLDWFTEGQYVFPLGKTGKLTDLQTGISFNIQRTVGASHSDTETVTAADTQTMKQLFGGTWNWTRRPFILEVDGRRFAVSVSGMPHAGVDGKPFLANVDSRSGDYGYGPNYDNISGNQMDGHFDLYFLNSLRHKDNMIDPDHQKMIMEAGGLH